MRQASFWIVNHAIISPHYDMEFADGPRPSVTLGDSTARLTLPSGPELLQFRACPIVDIRGAARWSRLGAQPSSPLWTLYVRIYEILWSLPAGTAFSRRQYDRSTG